MDNVEEFKTDLQTIMGWHSVSLYVSKQGLIRIVCGNMSFPLSTGPKGLITAGDLGKITAPDTDFIRHPG